MARHNGGPVKVGRRPPEGGTLTGPVTVTGTMGQEPAPPAPGCASPLLPRMDVPHSTDVPPDESSLSQEGVFRGL